MKHWFYRLLIGSGCIAASGVAANNYPLVVDSPEKPWFIAGARTPDLTGNLPARPAKPLLLAIVDDGLALDHPDYTRFISRNSAEIAGNFRDDDNNGFVDDTQGWDLSDNDADVSPPTDRIAEFYHGSYLAGIVARLATAALGDTAPDYLQILPVKVLSDYTASGQLEFAYEGVQFAQAAGADIVLAAWSHSDLQSPQKRILDQVIESDSLLVAAAGNTSSEKLQYPAAIPGVLSIAGSGRKKQPLAKSSWSPTVSLSAPGREITGSRLASPAIKETYSGTSFSAAIAATAAALVRLVHPELSKEQVIACLVNHTTPMANDHPSRAGKYGSGILDITGAVACDSLLDPDYQWPNDLTRGFITLAATNRPHKWSFNPPGEFDGIAFYRKDRRQPVDIAGSVKVTAESSGKKQVVEHALSRLPASFKVDSLPAILSYATTAGSSKVGSSLLLEYQVLASTGTRQHCAKSRAVDQATILEDGSAEKPYAANTSCQWLITAPEGHRIVFETQAMSTESGRDHLMIFNGHNTRQTDLLARLSGQSQPPTVRSPGNTATVWFITGPDNQGDGWRLKVSFEASE